MNKLIIGTTVGLAIGYAVAKMIDEEFMEKVCDEVNEFAGKAKEKARHAWEKGHEEMEHLKNQAEHTVNNVNNVNHRTTM